MDDIGLDLNCKLLVSSLSFGLIQAYSDMVYMIYGLLFQAEWCFTLHLQSSSIMGGQTLSFVYQILIICAKILRI